MNIRNLWRFSVSCLALTFVSSALAEEAKPVTATAVVDAFLKTLNQIKELPEAKSAEVTAPASQGLFDLTPLRAIFVALGGLLAAGTVLRMVVA